MESDARGQAQGAWHLEVASSREALLAGKPDVWDSGRVGGRDSLLVPYAGPPLEPARAYFWRVRVEDAVGRLTDWSAPARFVTALGDAADWGEARWIGYEDMPERERLVPGLHGLLDPGLRPKLKRPVVPLLRRVFTVRKPVARALLFVSGLGHYEAYLNGEKVGDRFLAPGWTDYDRTVLYDAFDVTDALRVGPNAIAAIVGNGFHHIAPERYAKLAIAYGWPKLLAALRIEYADGSPRDRLDRPRLEGGAVADHLHQHLRRRGLRRAARARGLDAGRLRRRGLGPRGGRHARRPAGCRSRRTTRCGSWRRCGR